MKRNCEYPIYRRNKGQGYAHRLAINTAVSSTQVVDEFRVVKIKDTKGSVEYRSVLDDAVPEKYEVSRALDYNGGLMFRL
jgi:hypothetical protein